MDPTILLDPNLAVELVIFLITFLMVVVLGLVLFGWLLYRSGQLPHPGPIVVSLSLLTAVALVGAMITGSGEVLTLAATGVGALAGSLAAIYRQTAASEDNDTVDDNKEEKPDA